MSDKITNFLLELGISREAIALAQKRSVSEPNILPIVLWQYGLIGIEELNRIFDWLETV